ncbi:hypothetical protein BTO18_02190 [Polaribacter porphyrae]|uniref:Uncharacterized protein n=1 Tax=Polaribacter porphyrae TaxID=1137780 RepID=A0A2S7WL95_9FLAO|nr:hypothetical protein BTO18_02190 [Polaribacter porphyrae]
MKQSVYFFEARNLLSLLAFYFSKIKELKQTVQSGLNLFANKKISKIESSYLKAFNFFISYFWDFIAL